MMTSFVKLMRSPSRRCIECRMAGRANSCGRMEFKCIIVPRPNAPEGYKGLVPEVLDVIAVPCVASCSQQAGRDISCASQKMKSL